MSSKIIEFISLLNSKYAKNYCWQASDLASKRISCKEYDIIKINRLSNILMLCRLILMKLLNGGKITSSKFDVLFITYFDKRILKEDPYFGKLKKHLNSNGSSFKTIGLTVNDRTIVRSFIKKSNDDAFIESYMSIGSILKSFVKIFFLKINFFEEVDDEKIRSVLINSFKNDYNNGHLFKMLCHYYAFKNLLNTCKVSKVIWPWENHRWERLLIMAHNDLNLNSKLVGYQHAALLLSWPQLFPNHLESAKIPLPDSLITTGKEAQNILLKHASFPNTCTLKTACALRYDYSRVENLQTIQLTRSLGIGLSMDKHLNIKILERVFSQLKDSTFKVCIRCHPVLPREEMEKVIKFPEYVTFEDAQDIGRFFGEISFLLYSSTSLCMDALYHGKYLVYMDLDGSDADDPLFESNHFKLVHRTGDNLQTQLESIIQKNTNDLVCEYQKASIYLKDYFAPVNEVNLQKFFD